MMQLQLFATQSDSWGSQTHLFPGFEAYCTSLLDMENKAADGRIIYAVTDDDRLPREFSTRDVTFYTR